MKSGPRAHTGIFLKGLPTPRSAKTSGLLKRMTSPWNLPTRELNLMNSYFAAIGLKLSNTLPPPTSCGHGKTCADKGATDTPPLTDAYVSKSETWREAVDAGFVVAVAFIDFQKAFDSVSHATLEMKLERDMAYQDHSWTGLKVT